MLKEKHKLINWTMEALDEQERAHNGNLGHDIVEVLLIARDAAHYLLKDSIDWVGDKIDEKLAKMTDLGD